MSEYIKIENERIVEHICGAQPEGYIEVPDGFRGFVGMSQKEFDADWNIRPLSERVRDGLVEVAPEFVLDGEELRPKKLSELVESGLVKVDDYHTLEGEGIREKTPRELVRDGLVEKPKGWKLVEDKDQPDGLNMEPMTFEEQLEAGEITQAEADFAQGVLVRGEREGYFKVYDAAASKLSRDIRLAKEAGKPATSQEAELAKWDAYAIALTEIPEQSGFPWKVIWPKRPDGVAV